MEHVNKPFLPAAGHDWALPLYDPFVKLLGGDAARKRLLDQASGRPMRRVLDVGCGTGTLAILIKQANSATDVFGLDPDPKALLRAQRKASHAGVSIRFDRGYSDALPYADESFDAVFSSFMFHHLEPGQKGKTLSEIRRVLAPGGCLHFLDFDRPDAVGWFSSRLHSSRHLKDNSEQRILALLREAAFVSAKRVAAGSMVFRLLRLGYYHAIRSAR